MPPRTDPTTAVVAAVLLLVGVAEVWFVLGLPLVEQVRPIPDDSFFFLRVARHLWAGDGFSFDGVTQNYGFQPLWQLLVTLLQPLAPSPVGQFRLLLAICCMLHVAIGGALYGCVRALCGRLGGVAAAAVWSLNPAMMVWCWGLKENGLYALLWVVALWLGGSLLAGRATRRRMLAFGVVLGLAVFTRVNALITAGGLLLALPVAFGAVLPFAARVRAAAVGAAVAAAVAAPWYVFAELRFGSALPTSGAWKVAVMKMHVRHVWQAEWLSAGHLTAALREWPEYLRFTLGNGFGLCEPVLAAAIGLGLVAAVWRLARGGRLAVATAWVLAAAVVGALAASFANVMMVLPYVRYADWYAVPEYVAIPIVFGAAVAALASWLRRPVVAAAAAVLAAAGYAVLPAQAGIAARLQRGLLAAPPREMQLLEMGLWAARHVPDDARCGICDPGIVSYFSGKCFISLDPLMNSLHYQQVEMADPLGYIARHRIAYMFGVGARTGDGWTFRYLPPGTYDVLWVPYPDHDIGWEPGNGLHYMIVRPHGTPAAEFLDDDDFGFGLLHPNDLGRRRIVTRDRDALLAGVELAADSVRIELAKTPADDGVELWVGDRLHHRFAAGASGWFCFDLHRQRGQRVRLRGSAAALASVLEAQLIDFDAGR